MLVIRQPFSRTTSEPRDECIPTPAPDGMTTIGISRKLRSPAGTRRWLMPIVAAIGLTVFGVFIAINLGAYAGESDSSGYMNHARVLATGSVHLPLRRVAGYTFDGPEAWLYSALGVRPSPDERDLVPTYPVGLPLMIAAAAKFVGWRQAGNVVMWIHCMLGVLVTYAAGRTFGLSSRLALLGSVLVGLSPVYVFLGIQVMSDVPALVWTAAAVLAAWRGRSQLGWAVAAGLGFAMAVLIRPTDVLAFVPIAVILGLSTRCWVAFGFGGVPGALFFVLHSHAAYGRFFTTGYGDSAQLEGQWVGMTLFHYIHWLPLLFTPAIVAFLALPFVPRPERRNAVVLGSWFVVLAAFYAGYRYTHETWWYLRFLLPAAPALVIGALLVLRTAVRARLSPPFATVTLGIAVAVAIGWNVHWIKKLSALSSKHSEQTYLLTTDWLKAHLPPNAVIAAMQETGALQYYTDFTFVRWDWLHPDTFDALTRAVTANRQPLYAILHPYEWQEQGAFKEHMPSGTWTQIGSVREVTIWQWTAAKPAPASNRAFPL